jgi:hypothetical protein
MKMAMSCPLSLYMTNSYKLAERINNTVNASVTYKTDKQVEAPYGWADTYCPSHKNEII